MVLLDAACTASGGPGGLGVNEQFCVRKAADEEGYMLLKRVDLNKTVYLAPVETGPVQHIAAINPMTLVVDKGKLAWEFVKVDHDVDRKRG